MKLKAKGKLLLTGEYLVLDGANALAIPLIYGQELEYIPETDSNTIKVSSLELDKEWFSASFKIGTFQVIETSNESVSSRLQQLFVAAKKETKLDLLDQGAKIIISSNFSLDSGFGSSSTLVSLIAQLTQINPFHLNEVTFGGSGYDIACAQATTPIIYKRENNNIEVIPTELDGSITKNIFFIYSGQKMNSREAIEHYKSLDKNELSEAIRKMNLVTASFLKAIDFSDLNRSIEESEELLSEVLQIETIKSKYFKDYPYAIKSLGAWGGDYFLALGNNIAEVKEYFNKKGYNKIICYQDITVQETVQQ